MVGVLRLAGCRHAAVQRLDSKLLLSPIVCAIEHVEQLLYTPCTVWGGPAAEQPSLKCCAPNRWTHMPSPPSWAPLHLSPRVSAGLALPALGALKSLAASSVLRLQCMTLQSCMKAAPLVQTCPSPAQPFAHTAG